MNCAGLEAPALAAVLNAAAGPWPAAVIPEGWLAKGNYYRLEGARTPFSRLVYPVPEARGAGLAHRAIHCCTHSILIQPSFSM